MGEVRRVAAVGRSRNGGLADTLEAICARVMPVVGPVSIAKREAVASDDLKRLFERAGFVAEREVKVPGGRIDLLVTDGLHRAVIETKAHYMPPTEAIGQVLFYAETLRECDGKPSHVVVAAPALPRVFTQAFRSVCAATGVRMLGYGFVATPPVYRRTQKGICLDGYPELRAVLAG